MSLSTDDLQFSYRWGADAFRRFTADVQDARFAEQPVAGMNHPAWLLGHVTTYHDVIAKLLRGESFDNPWDAPCGKNSTPTSDRSAYAAKEAILAEFDAGFARACEAIAAAPAEAWARPVGHPTWGKQFASVAPAVVFLSTTHLAMHLGQLSGWRRAAGLPRV